MKAWKHFTIMAIVAIIALALTALSLTGCPPEPDPKGDDTSPHTHEWEWVVTTPATTEADGLETETCKTCGETRGTKLIAKLPPEHTHDYGTAWKSNATQHWKECSCGDKTDEADHDWEWVVTTPATTTADGLETETCTTCGATNGTRPITKLEEQQPQEDDIENLFINDFTVTIKGTFTDTEWLGIRDQVISALTTAYNAADVFDKSDIRAGFKDATITIEKTSTYTLYKTVASNSTSIFININGLSGLTSAKLLEAANAMGTDTIDGVT